VVPAPVTPRAHVLVVDPDAGVRDVCTSLLHHLGFHALVRSTPDDLATALSRSVDVVLCDVEALQGRASDWLRGLKRSHPRLRVLVMSGHPTRDLGVFLAHGADGVLQKPFRLTELDGHLRGV
jgi:DNA-binding NtrC family response regulator